jgi:hypothetical protein
MTKNLIKGGLHIIDNKAPITKLHKIDGINIINIVKADVETEGTEGSKGDSLNAKKKYTLYKLFDINNYNSENFILPPSITNTDVNNIYLFGLREKKFFVKKNNKVNGDLKEHYNDIGKSLKNLYKNGGNVNIILVHHNESKELYIFFVMNNNIKEEKFNLFENGFSVSLFNNDNNDLKKKLDISYLNDLIEFTKKKVIDVAEPAAEEGSSKEELEAKKTRFLLNLLFLNTATKRIWVGGAPYEHDKINGYYTLNDNGDYSNGMYVMSFTPSTIDGDKVSTKPKWNITINNEQLETVAYIQKAPIVINKNNLDKLGRQPWHIQILMNNQYEEYRGIEVLNGDTYDFINNINHDNMIDSMIKYSDK